MMKGATKYYVMGNRYGAGNPAYDGLNRLTQFGGAAIQYDLLGNRLQDGRYRYQWDALNRLISMQTYQQSGRFVVIGDSWRFAYRADGLRVVKEKVSQAVGLEGSAGGSSRVEYLYDGQMPVCEQEFEDGVLQATRVNFLGARGIEAVLTIDHTRGNQARLSWLLYDGHGNLVRVMASDYTLSGFQWRGVWGEVQSSLGAGRGYCANLGHSEDETGLVYMRARYYEPASGRFISEDPSRDGVNWYLYADANPVNKVDENGEVSIHEILRWLAAAIGAGLAWEFIRPFFSRPVQLLGYALLSVSQYLIRAGSTNALAGLIELRVAGIGGSLVQSLGLGLRGIGRTLLGAGEIALGLALRAIAIYIIGVGEGMLHSRWVD